MATTVSFTKTLPASSATSIAASQSPGAGAIVLNGSAVVQGVATIDTYNAVTNSEPGVNVTVTSGGNDSGITFTVTGTNSTGQIISDTFAGGNIAAATSNQSFMTVTAVTHTGAVAGTVTVGNGGTGATRWITWDYFVSPPFNLGFAVEVTGVVNYTVQYTYDDPNNLMPGVAFPAAFPTTLVSQTTNKDSSLTTPIVATRVLINSGTGTVRSQFVQAGLG